MSGRRQSSRRLQDLQVRKLKREQKQDEFDSKFPFIMTDNVLKEFISYKGGHCMYNKIDKENSPEKQPVISFNRAQACVRSLLFQTTDTLSDECQEDFGSMPYTARTFADRLMSPSNEGTSSIGTADGNFILAIP